MLELTERGSPTERHPAPLLFVHGAFQSAWCWEEHFLDYFADRGYRAIAVSLRGHGGSSSAKPLRRCSISDYVDDVSSVVGELPNSPVLIGHSMGGFVVAKYLETQVAPAAVVLASTPPRTARTAMYRDAVRHPWSSLQIGLTRSPRAGLRDSADRVRELLFSVHTPDTVVRDFLDRLEDESFRALCLDMPLLNRVQVRRVTTPVLVLGAEHDRGVSPRAARATARAYRTEAEIFPNMGHEMMLEQGWAAVAERIDQWVSGIAALPE